MPIHFYSFIIYTYFEFENLNELFQTEKTISYVIICTLHNIN